MEKEFVKYEQALALKELGFDEKCLAYWFNETPLNPEGQCLVYYRKPYDNVGITNGIIREYGWAPLYQQAFRFFREKHNLKSWIQEHTADTFIYEIRPHKLTDYKEGEVYVYKKHEEAELACLNKLIQIVKNKKD